MKNLADDPTWADVYHPVDLLMIQIHFKNFGKKALIYQCACCDKWSAHAADNPNILLPVSVATKEECITWLKDNDFQIIGEYFDGEILNYN